MYDYMKALQKRFDRQPHPDLDAQVEYAHEELRRDMDAAGRGKLHIQQRSRCGDGVPVKQQYLTPLINKMLFYITKLSVIIVPTKQHAVKGVKHQIFTEDNDYGFH